MRWRRCDGNCSHQSRRSDVARAGAVTFSEHVAPIIVVNCTTCHRPGEAAPFALMSYRDARPFARAIAAATASRAMPPWKAGPGDYPFSDARKLTDDQIATIQKWVANGAVEGDPARLPSIPRFTEGCQLGPPTLTATMEQARRAGAGVAGLAFFAAKGRSWLTSARPR